MKKYILFDNDGVLVETEPWYFEASKITLKEYFNIDFKIETYMNLMVRGGNVWQEAEQKGHTQNEILIARNKRNEYYQEFIKTKNINIDGVKSSIKNLSKKYKIAIVTAARRDDFELIHKNSGILQYIDFTLCEEDFKNSKPNPEPYLKAQEKFNAKKEECIIIEDSQRGLTSAFNADIDCVMVYNEFSSTQDFTNASYKINSIKDLEKLLYDIK